MTNPTQTWTFAGPYSFTIASTTPTIAELLLGIKTVITDHASFWAVSDFSAVNGTLELKRNSLPSAPTGEIATVRILLFGGTAPNAAALAGGHSAGVNTSLYAGLSVDANTTGPAAAYGSGAPYTTKYSKASSITPAASLTAANSVRITLAECDDAICVFIADNSVACSMTAGRIIVRAVDDVLQWGVMNSGGTFSLTGAPSTMTATAAHPLTPLTTASNTVKAVYWDTLSGSARLFGRVIQSLMTTADTGLGASGSPAAIIPVPIGEAPQSAGSTPNFLGFLRQIRLGPIALHKTQLRNGAAVLQATHLCGGSIAAVGLWFDEVI